MLWLEEKRKKKKQNRALRIWSASHWGPGGFQEKCVHHLYTADAQLAVLMLQRWMVKLWMFAPLDFFGK